MYSKKNNQQPGAWICTNENGQQNRGRLKVHQPGSKIYLQDGDEFELELHNPTLNNIKAEIKIDGKPICSGGLIIRRGERIYLECFPDNKKKFTFKTYVVDDSSESRQAISDNGRVEVNFYKEKIKQSYCNSYPWNSGNLYYHDTNIYGNGNTTGSGFKTFTTATNIGSTLDVLRSSSVFSQSNLMETGQVDGGDQSDQEFELVDMDFESYAFKTYSFQVLPISQKPLSKKSFKTKPKRVSETPISNKLEDLLKLTKLLEDNLIDRNEYDKLKSEMI